MPEGRQRYVKLQEFVAHRGAVNCVAIGRKTCGFLVTGGDDKRCNVWTVGTKNKILSLPSVDVVTAVAFDNAEERVAAGGGEGGMRICDLATPKVFTLLGQHDGRVRCLQVTPHGCVSGSNDQTVRVWDMRTPSGCATFCFKGHAAPVICARYSSNGQWVASGDEAGGVRVWDVRASKLAAELSDGHSAAATSIQFHPSKPLMGSCSADKTVKLWDLDTLSLVQTLPSEVAGVTAMTFHNDGTHLLGCTSAGLRVWGGVGSALAAKSDDFVDIQWAGIADVALFPGARKLVGATAGVNNVGLYFVDLAADVEPWAHSRTRPSSGASHVGSMNSTGAGAAFAAAMASSVRRAGGTAGPASLPPVGGSGGAGAKGGASGARGGTALVATPPPRTAGNLGSVHETSSGPGGKRFGAKGGAKEPVECEKATLVRIVSLKLNALAVPEVKAGGGGAGSPKLPAIGGSGRGVGVGDGPSPSDTTRRATSVSVGTQAQGASLCASMHASHVPATPGGPNSPVKTRSKLSMAAVETGTGAVGPRAGRAQRARPGPATPLLGRGIGEGTKAKNASLLQDVLNESSGSSVSSSDDVALVRDNNKKAPTGAARKGGAVAVPQKGPVSRKDKVAAAAAAAATAAAAAAATKAEEAAAAATVQKAHDAALHDVLEHHDKARSTLSLRLASLTLVKNFAKKHDLRGAAGAARRTGDAAVNADLLAGLLASPHQEVLLTLAVVPDLVACASLCLVPHASEYHVRLAVDVLALVHHAFGDAIKEMLASAPPPRTGADISFEARLDRAKASRDGLLGLMVPLNEVGTKKSACKDAALVACAHALAKELKTLDMGFR
ncbi:hypothetical protein FOA52_013938 [Chlamydomonas sp. UWO 241]|nr:hypothetical protein FOA52_013938 [Chlamydomonas sp. UWO 241]